MLDLDWNLLLSPSPRWAYYTCSSYYDIDTSVVSYRENGPQSDKTVVRIIRASYCLTGIATFDHWAAALQFPYYFGRNINAFDDCIKDLGWLRANHYIFVITSAQDLLREESNQAFSTFLSVLQEAAELWSRPDFMEWADPDVRAKYARDAVSFRVLFQSTQEHKDETINRYALAGCNLTVI